MQYLFTIPGVKVFISDYFKIQSLAGSDSDSDSGGESMRIQTPRSFKMKHTQALRVTFRAEAGMLVRRMTTEITAG